MTICHDEQQTNHSITSCITIECVVDIVIVFVINLINVHLYYYLLSTIFYVVVTIDKNISTTIVVTLSHLFE